MTTKTYNGHKNWAYWNVALWIANDEGLYRFAKDCLRSHRNRRDAARSFVQDMNDWGDGTTPLIAAMRCYVASKLGDVVDVPEELAK